MAADSGIGGVSGQLRCSTQWINDLPTRTVAVGERVDRLELEMGDGGFEEGVQQVVG